MVYGMFALALGLTIAIEGSVVWVWFRSWRWVYYSVLCNFLTNPAMNLILVCAVRALGRGAYGPALAVLECAVVAVEARVWRMLAVSGWKRAWMISIVTNAVSFAAGLLWSRWAT